MHSYEDCAADFQISTKVVTVQSLITDTNISTLEVRLVMSKLAQEYAKILCHSSTTA